MKAYLDLLRNVLDNGIPSNNRTGVKTYALFGQQVHYDLSETYPLLTTKKINIKAVIHELLWFIRGDTNTRYLKDHGVGIWDAWADANGDLGPIYGYQWRFWKGADQQVHDQLRQVVHDIQHQPQSRRLIVSAWNVADLNKMRLPPCHILFQFHVAQGRLSCQLYQRSADLFIGVPFNIASYALLTLMVAQVTGLKPGKFIHTFGDVHIYDNHIEQVKTQLQRTPKALPRMKLQPTVDDLFAFQYDDFELQGYTPDPHIVAPVVV